MLVSTLGRLKFEGAPCVVLGLAVFITSYTTTVQPKLKTTRLRPATTIENMTVFAIEYHYPADSALITQIRPEHRAFLAKLKDEGTLIGSGPYTDGDGGALIIIRLADGTLDQAKALMDQDPFHLNNALDNRIFHTWNPVLNVFNE